MARVEQFDAFYHAARGPLLHQTYALTGDLDQTVDAVELAFAHGWSQWRKVRHLPDPVAWVRGEAWRVAAAQRVRRRWLRSARRRPATPVQGPHAGDLQALRDLPDAQRRAVVLRHLADQPVERIAREIGITESSAASLVRRGEQPWAERGIPIGAALESLGEDLAGVRLSRAPTLRRSGERRHRRQTVTGLAAAAALVVGGGLLIVNDQPARLQPSADAAPAATGQVPPPAAPDGSAESDAPMSAMSPSTPEPFRLDDGALLSADQMARLTRPSADWSVTSTTAGTAGDRRYAPCQQAPLADPRGDQALLRRYESDRAGLSAVHALERSRDDRQAARAFDTMRDWYARCGDDGVQLLDTVRVQKLGDEAAAFRLRRVDGDGGYVTVGLVRTGPVVGALVATGREPVPVPRVLGRLATSVTGVCVPVSGDCGSRPQTSDRPPLPTRDNPGFLAAYDLPRVSDVSAPWVGTDPRPSPDNPAATPCERATFGPPQHPRTRVFVLPTAHRLPRRFGLTETVGSFADRANARAFVRRAYQSARDCPDRELSAARPRVVSLPDGRDGRVWRFEFEVDQRHSVFYRVGLVRTGRRVALLSMSPSEAYDVSRHDFVNLVVRAGQRLAEAPDD